MRTIRRVGDENNSARVEGSRDVSCISETIVGKNINLELSAEDSGVGKVV